MKDFYSFATENPALVIILAIIIGCTIATVFESVASIF